MEFIEAAPKWLEWIAYVYLGKMNKLSPQAESIPQHSSFNTCIPFTNMV